LKDNFNTEFNRNSTRSEVYRRISGV